MLSSGTAHRPIHLLGLSTRNGPLSEGLACRAEPVYAEPNSCEWSRVGGAAIVCPEPPSPFFCVQISLPGKLAVLRRTRVTAEGVTEAYGPFEVKGIWWSG